MKKIFASDFDGTLYIHGKTPPIAPASIQVIRRFQREGGLFGLCTGRPLVGVSSFLEEIRPDFIIASSGACIVLGDTPLFQKGISREVADTITGELLPKGYQMMFCAGEHICFFTPMDLPFEHLVVSRLTDAPEGLLYQVSIHTDSQEEAARIIEDLLHRFGDEIEAFQNITNIDIAPKGCSKGAGYRLLGEHLEKLHGRCQLYGIGDDLNDLPLLTASDVSYAFPYSPPLLRRKATKVVDTIAQALEDCFLSHS